jgi:hypothetical protein
MVAQSENGKKRGRRRLEAALRRKNKNALYPCGRLTKNSTVRMLLKCLFGGIAYGLVEILWRGYTHPSMVLTGGICFAMICTINRRFSEKPLLVRGAMGALGVTAVEFCVGMLVNQWLNMGVWDYSDQPVHLLGQICLLYTGFWFGISLALCFALSQIRLRVISLNLQK